MVKTNELEQKAVQIRLDTLNALHRGNLGYAGSCMSVVDILVALYYGELLGKPVMNYDSARPGWAEQDFLLLSKGQAAAVQYSILADLGFFDKSELDFIGKPGAMLTARPNGKVPGITASVLSYGHGLSVALGMAMAMKMERKQNKVFAVLGDGELSCGQVWEAAMSAYQYKLNNLIAIVDNNKVAANGPVAVDFIQDKFESFGWQVIQVTDGHNFDRILDGLSRAFTSLRRPVCLWCHTIVAKGIEFAERKANYHWASLSDGEISVIIPKLEELYEQYSHKIG